jgi:hypothetical protein
MKNKINSYFAALLVTIAGAGATLLIVHIATTDTLAATVYGSEGALLAQHPYAKP